MVRFSPERLSDSLPLQSVFVSKKQQCLRFLKRCVSVKHIYQIHAQIQVHGCGRDTSFLNELVHLASLSSSSGKLRYARILLFDSADFACSTWNMLIRGYASSFTPKEVMTVFREMKRRGIKPDKLTFPFLFKACSAFSGLTAARQSHAEVLKRGMNSDVYVGNNLVHAYGCCKKLSNARRVFEEMRERTVVSWNAMITACTENDKFDIAIECFFKMESSGFLPDETTMVVVITACNELGNLSLGKRLHSQLITRGLQLNCKLGTALVDMYSKCGGLDFSRIIFAQMRETNVWTWSAMILGLAQYGFGEEALQLFSEMKENSTIRPNYVTFLGVLVACSHTGLVNEGYKYFHEMKNRYGIKPMMIHYGAMVDVLSRAGRLNEAYSFITNMPLDPDPIVWRTLLSACTVHPDNDNDGIGDEARKRLLAVEPRRSGNLVIAANMYAEAGMWDRAENVRRAMKKKGIKKIAGESCLELGGFVHRFFSGYDSRPDFECIYQLSDWLNLHMKMVDSQ